MAVLFLFLFGAASQAQIAQRNSRFMQVVVFDVRVCECDSSARLCLEKNQETQESSRAYTAIGYG